MRRFAVLLAGSTIAVACGSNPPPPPDLVSLDTMRAPDHSCAYVCPPPAGGCAEQTTPYACPALGPWDTLEHDDPCPTWGDGQYPAVTPGQCTATDPSGDAVAYAGPASGHVVLSDGRWIAPAGSDWVFSDLPGGLTSGLALVPSTTLALTVDTGYDDHVVRLVDVSAIGSGNDPTLAKVQFAAPETLNSGLAYVAPDLVYVATDDGVVQALTLDTANKTLVRDDTRNLALPPAKDGNGNSVTWYASGLAVSPDGTKLVVASVNTTSLLVYDLGTKQLAGTVDLGKYEAYGVWFDPNDATGSHVYVTIWQDHTVDEIDVTDATAPSISRTFDTQKDPQSIAFLDARFFVVGNDLGDSLTIVDRVGGTTTTVPTDSRMTLYGQEPTALAYDATNHRLYSTLAGMNAHRRVRRRLGDAAEPHVRGPPTRRVLAVRHRDRGRRHRRRHELARRRRRSAAALLRHRRRRHRRPDARLDRADPRAASRGSHARRRRRRDVRRRRVAGGRAHGDLPERRERLPRPGDERERRVDAHRARLLHRAREQGLRRALRRLPERQRRADLRVQERAAGPRWTASGTTSARSRARSRSATTTTPTRSTRRRATSGRRTAARTTSTSARGSSPARARARVPSPAAASSTSSRPDRGIALRLARHRTTCRTTSSARSSARRASARRRTTRSTSRYPGGPFQNIGYNDLEKACYAVGRVARLLRPGHVHLHDAAERSHVRRLADEPDARDVSAR